VRARENRKKQCIYEAIKIDKNDLSITIAVTEKDVKGKKMNACLSLKEKHRLLKDRLNKNLQKKHTLELQIGRQFEKLKKLEISLEKCACTAEGRE
jgi:hypothetical protein